MTALSPSPTTTPARTGSQRQRVLFIGGLGRSGSTLVESMLNELPSMVGVGETIHLWERGIRDQERCACGETFGHCPRWSAIGARAFGGWDRVDLDEIIGLRWSIDRSRRLPLIAASHLRRRPTPAEARYLDHLRAVLLAAASLEREPGSTVILESSKHLSTAALLALDDHLDVRVVHLVRDPRGVAYSWTKEVARPEADGDLMPRYPPSRTALRWVTDNAGFELLARRVPTLTVRYEDVLAEPARWLRAMGELAGLGADEIDLGFLDGNRATVSTPLHSVAGNPMRFGGQTLTLRLDDAWRSKLPAGQRRLVTAMTAPLLGRYGHRR